MKLIQIQSAALTKTINMYNHIIECIAIKKYILSMRNIFALWTVSEILIKIIYVGNSNHFQKLESSLLENTKLNLSKYHGLKTLIGKFSVTKWSSANTMTMFSSNSARKQNTYAFLPNEIPYKSVYKLLNIHFKMKSIFVGLSIEQSSWARPCKIGSKTATTLPGLQLP